MSQTHEDLYLAIHQLEAEISRAKQEILKGEKVKSRTLAKLKRLAKKVEHYNTKLDQPQLWTED